MNQPLIHSSQLQYNTVPRSILGPTSEAILPTQDRPFNGFRIARTVNATIVAKEVGAQVQAYEMHRVRSRARRPKDQLNFERQVEALVCDLAHRELTKPNAWLTVSFSKQFLGKKNRYRANVFRETLPAVIEHMASGEMEFIEIEKGKRNVFNASLSKQTVIRAGRRLIDRIKEHRLVLEDFGLDKTQEIIILKDTKEDLWDSGEWLQYPDTEETHAYREELARINSWIEQADIEHVPLYDTNTVVDTTDRKLRRYFNNGNFGHGGRLFGGFWQHMSRKARAGIVIDGMDTVTLDYGQMIARVLYGHAGAPFDFDDAYRIPGLENHRAGVKKVFSAMLYADHPLTRMPQGCRELFPSKVSYAAVAGKIRQFHAPVSEFLYVGVGPKLTFQESKILLIVLTKLLEQGITALPLHDAVIVAKEHQNRTTEIMLEVFRMVTGIDGLVSLDD
jgi:ribosomal protein L30/L7E